MTDLIPTATACWCGAPAPYVLPPNGVRADYLLVCAEHVADGYDQAPAPFQPGCAVTWTPTYAATGDLAAPMFGIVERNPLTRGSGRYMPEQSWRTVRTATGDLVELRAEQLAVGPCPVLYPFGIDAEAPCPACGREVGYHAGAEYTALEHLTRQTRLAAEAAAEEPTPAAGTAALRAALARAAEHRAERDAAAASSADALRRCTGARSVTVTHETRHADGRLTVTAEATATATADERVQAAHLEPGWRVTVFAHPAGRFGVTSGADVTGWVRENVPADLPGTTSPGRRITFTDGRTFDAVAYAVATHHAAAD